MFKQSLTGSNRCPLRHDLTIRNLEVADLKPLGRETRKHSPQQIRKIAKSITQFGVILPIVVDPVGRVVAGWGLVQAAKTVELAQLPGICVTDLSEPELRALRLALNRTPEDGSWDRNELALELREIVEQAPELEIDTTGFEMGEIDVLLGSNGFDEEDEVPSPNLDRPSISRLGDLYVLGDHAILCGDARETTSYAALLRGAKAQMSFVDAPYNVRIDGHASGLGAVKHAEFRMASGEMSPAEFTAFLQTVFSNLAAHAADGSVHYLCIDWRHVLELMTAANATFDEQLNLCVWRKTIPGMGSLYRSGHELVLVFKKGRAPHTNNVALGKHGRSRSNVWDYVGQNSLNGTSRSKLSLHPTVKPVALIADAMRDCSNRGDIILDPFGGAGTTIIAAERTGRKARVIELEPKYVDVAVERWQRASGQVAVHADTGQPFGAEREPIEPQIKHSERKSRRGGK